jgi:hypothetical protein
MAENEARAKSSCSSWPARATHGAGVAVIAIEGGLFDATKLALTDPRGSVLI